MKETKIMKDMAKRLLEMTEGCRNDMHEPDEQDLTADVIGSNLDNAFGEAITPYAVEAGFQEFVVILRRYMPDALFKIEKFNLATLIALARIGAGTIVKKSE